MTKAQTKEQVNSTLADMITKPGVSKGSSRGRVTREVL